jgi:uncharacterized Zn finger protein
MSYYDWRPYVPVAERRRQAESNLAKLRKKGPPVAPVRIEGRTIARSFWGKSWCQNLERYSDYANRLPRGRSYVRNGSVVDLQIAKGEVVASVAGSRLYTTRITVAPVAAAHWKSICRDCAGTVDSLVELLQGRLAKGVMDRVCREGDGLFPSPREIKLSCSCPDWADMCKHVAAVLYGVGARLDEQPRLIFMLRGVDEHDLLAGAGQDLPLAKPKAANVLKDDDVAALFGLDMAETAVVDRPVAGLTRRSQRPKTKGHKVAADKTVAPRKAPRRMPAKSKSRRTAPASAEKRGARPASKLSR